eukprot:gene13121-biopygen3935
MQPKCPHSVVFCPRHLEFRVQEKSCILLSAAFAFTCVLRSAAFRSLRSAAFCVQLRSVFRILRSAFRILRSAFSCVRVRLRSAFRILRSAFSILRSRSAAFAFSCVLRSAVFCQHSSPARGSAHRSPLIDCCPCPESDGDSIAEQGFPESDLLLQRRGRVVDCWGRENDSHTPIEDE